MKPNNGPIWGKPNLSVSPIERSSRRWSTGHHKPYRTLVMLVVSIVLGLFLSIGSLEMARSQVSSQATINLDRTPAPPAFVQPGQNLLITWTIEFSTTPFSYTLAIFDKSIVEGGGTRLFFQIFDATGLSSPITDTLSWNVPLTVANILDSNPDTFRIELDYYSDFVGGGLESRAQQTFLVDVLPPTPTPPPLPPGPGGREEEDDDDGPGTIPEPATITLVSLGLAGLAGYAARRRAKRNKN